MNLINTYYHSKIELLGQALGKKKNVATSKMNILRKSARKLKKYYFFTLWQPTILKKETIWAKTVETKNANDVIAYVVLDLHIIRNLTEQNKHGSSKHAKL